MAPPPNSPAPQATPAALEFLREILGQIRATGRNKKKLFEFFQAHLDQLNDEALLPAIPHVFAELTQGISGWRQQEVAADFNSLGVYFNEFPLGNRALNQELSIAAYQAALQVYTRDAFPQDWAMTQHNLANAYRDRVLGDALDNLGQAIWTYQQAAQVFTQDALPIQWAENQGRLAAAFLKRAALTENAEDLNTAIALLSAALTKAVPGSQDYSDSQYRLGNALSRRYEHSQNPDDLQGALAAYTAALTAISPEHWDRPQIWQAIPQTQTILGSRLVRQGQWQQGLELLLNSVRQLSASDDKQAHANALYQTGRAHETLADLENARLYYRDALRLYDHLSDTLGIAHCKLGLGSVLASQGYLEKGLAELETTRELYQQLHQPERATQVNGLIQATQTALNSPSHEAFV